MIKKIKRSKKEFDYIFGKPRLEIAGGECLVDGLKSVVEYSDTKISVSLGSQIIVFNGFDLKINSFTKEGAIIEGNITYMEFLSWYIYSDGYSDMLSFILKTGSARIL